MKLVRTYLVIFIFVLVGSHNVLAEELKLAVGLALPPYVFTETDSGIELDIVKEALSIEGFSIDPIYLPFGRIPMHLQIGRVDGAITISESSGLQNVFYSDSHIFYQNVVVTLKKNKYQINTVEDLSDKSIVAFQNANKYLGKNFSEVMKINTDYIELHDQENQVIMLYMERTQAIVLDINIFKYYRQKITKINTDKPVVIHRIFPKTPYKVAFISVKTCDQFNLGLRTLRKNGRYDEILRKYAY